ncbi:ABC transporter permease [Rhizobium wenxiniae]|uniref:Peptide/nickel transport system permease protein n=1 Tax=Rhizobium wenxiniae TaxID=1737357 RepID=A0A7W9YC66_9HYPH|nr:ABC transporter permease [Rhizobium wenxiniae]MBB6165845.1 peptide/nickel transport system permease protein [Rhizobium wenxiniae]GGG19470.1 ABC transporter permease [Rhizobium wenxiniae]
MASIHTERETLAYGGASAGLSSRWAVARSTLALAFRSIIVFVTVFFLATLLTFALQGLSGLSPAHLQLSESATPEAIAALEHEWGLDLPLWQQYLNWFGGIVQGDLGRSWYNGADISLLLTSRAAISLSIAGLALLIGVTLGAVLGITAAKFQTTWIDRAITTFTTFVSVLPPFVVGIGLVAIFAVWFNWFPSAGYVPLDRGGLGPWLSHIWLPSLALSMEAVADIARQLRVGLIQASRENYVTGALVRGLSSERIFWGHVLRNGSGPALTMLGMKFPNLIGGAVVTEAVFGLAGYGRFAADSASRGDVPAVQGVLVLAIVLVVAFNLLVNLLLVRLSPASARGI